ncbi:TetR/AcrR family transcriptional regulator [Pendulispora albinea]|uniref:TetR/AcrR family transcriptional regulator n=1 Tax=Pendulispora albinea TaxID=2741071 RepID=A0ABZ2LQ61_9BACT
MKRPYAPRVPPEQRREQLLDIALRIINREGVGAVTMDAVARKAGVTRPVVYDHFEDADHVLRAVLDRENNRALAQLTAIFGASFDPKDPAKAIVEVVRGLMQMIHDHPETWRFALMPVGGTPAPVARRIERGRDMVCKRIEALLGERDVDAELLAKATLGAVLEMGRLVLSDATRFSPERIAGFAEALARRWFGSPEVRRRSRHSRA